MSAPAKSLAARLLSERGKPAPSHPVTLHLLGKNDQGIDTFADADAILVFVPDAGAHVAIDAAEAALAGKNPSPARREAENAYHLLAEALRDPQERARRVFATVLEAKSYMVEKEAVRLRNEYGRFVDAHYPDSLSVAEIAEIGAVARDHFLPDLLTRFGLLPMLRALPSLAVSYGSPLMPNSSPIV